MNRPSTYPYWTDSGIYVIQPPAELAETGWAPGVAPDAQHHNWLFGNINDWVMYLDQLTNVGIPNSTIRLINGGSWSFDAETGVLAWSQTGNLSIMSLADSANQFAAGSVTLADGDIAYLTANLPIESLGNTSTTSNPNQITNMNFVGNIEPGYTVSGPGIPGGTTVTGVGANFVTLSQNVTSNNTQATYVFAPVGTLVVQSGLNSSVQPSLDTIMIARRAGSVVYLGVNCAQTVLRDGEFKYLNQTGYSEVYSGTAGEDLSAGTLVYISPGSSDGGRTAGALYPLDVSAANQAVRGIFAGIVVSPVTTGNPVFVMFSGFYAFSDLTEGVNYYADPANPGGITTPSPSEAGAKIVQVGFSTSTTVLAVDAASAPPGPATQPIIATQEFSGNGSQTSFTLSNSPLNSESVFVYLDGIIQQNSVWSLSGDNVVFDTAPAIGQDIYIKYIETAQAYLVGYQGSCGVGSGSQTTFSLPFVPMNQASLDIFVDGLVQPEGNYSLNISGESASITFTSAPAAGQDIYAVGLGVVGGTGSGGINSCQNLGSGFGIFSAVTGTTAQFFSLKPGTNCTMEYDGDGDLVINCTGGGGGGGPTANGSYEDPVVITPSAGITPLNPSSIGEEIWWITPTGSTPGANPITSTPQIAAATVVGKRLTIFGVTNGAGGYIKIANGNGVLSNGDFDFITGQCLVYVWDGNQWSMVSNAV